MTGLDLQARDFQTASTPPLRPTLSSAIVVQQDMRPTSFGRPGIDQGADMRADFAGLRSADRRFGLVSLTNRAAGDVAPLAFEASSEQTGLAFDVGFAPRIAFERNDVAQRRSTGAEVRLGENLDFQETNAPAWYVFAAADDQALTWDVGGEGVNLVDGVKLADRITIGDLQAGLAFSRAGGQLAISYVRREFSYEDARSEENFAAVSFTMRR